MTVMKRCPKVSNTYLNLTLSPVSAAEVKFSPQSERDREKTVASGDAIVLYCEVSHAFAHVSWFKDGVELQANDGLTVQSEGNMRRIVVQSAEASDSGVYACRSAGDVVEFNVQVAGKRGFSVHEHRRNYNRTIFRYLYSDIQSGNTAHNKLAHL